MTEEEDTKELSLSNNKTGHISSAIQVVARVRPCFNKSEDYKDMVIDEINPNIIRFGEERYQFNKIFWKDSSQETIFNSVAKPLIEHAFNGYNATLFAYGQTGSGKTYTLSGGYSYEERGIIPRSIAFCYELCKKDANFRYQVMVSYIELFNLYTYDLLSNQEASRSSEKLLRVNIHDTPNGILLNHDVAGNTSPLVECDDFETALSQLFLGETNRHIAETAANEVSSRSHCIFTLHLEGKNKQTGETRSSKINLVDLAGSERIDMLDDYKDRIKEACSINTSLFSLHQVITALNEKREYIPYRNSRLTLMLKDSLGGNCMTTMIAALSSSIHNIKNTIETCKFSRNVMLIRNRAFKNLSQDPQLLIKALRAEIVKLRHDLAVALGEKEDTPVSDSELKQIQHQITEYMNGRSDFPLLTPSRFKVAFDYASTHFSGSGGDASRVEKIERVEISDTELKKAITEYQKMIKRREAENEVLVALLTKNKSEAWTQTNIYSGESTSGSNIVQKKPESKADVFQKFFLNHPKHRNIEANKKLMMQKIDEAKQLTNKGHDLKAEINTLREHIKELDEDKEEEYQGRNDELRSKIQTYMDITSRIKSLKQEIETIDQMTKACKNQVKKDFSEFWNNHCSQFEATSSGTGQPSLESSVVTSSKLDFEATNSTSQYSTIKTGDAAADEIISKFEESKAQFLRMAKEARSSKSAK